MITLSQFISQIRDRTPSVEIKFRYPVLYLVYVSEMFANIFDEARESLFFSEHEINPNDAVAVIRSGGIQLILCTPEERVREYGFLDAPGATSHWAEFLANPHAGGTLASSEHKSRFIHFYGYKGGQARSSVLAMLAQNLASDGYTVLVVDADLEAPSLHTLFRFPSPPPSATLLGCVLHQLRPEPRSVFFPVKGAGRVDLLACRPPEQVYDLDAANFALHAGLDPSMVAKVIGQISAQQSWDVTLVDHRTGLSPSVLPIVIGLPGPVIVCMRLDEQSTQAAPFFSALFRQHPSEPGLLMSFSLDPKDTRSSLFEGKLAKIEQALQPLADALSFDKTEAIAPEEIHDYWVPWFHDGAFLSKLLPEAGDIRLDNYHALRSIRTLLGLPRIESDLTLAVPFPVPVPVEGKLSASGNDDAGTLIQNEALRKLLPHSTPFTYIVGRKGTGKTRLLRELAERKHGEPMLVADDYPHDAGIKSSDALIIDLALLFHDEPARLWWALLDASLVSTQRSAQQAALQSIYALVSDKGVAAFTISAVRNRILALPKKKVFLIDGVETAFNSTRILAFVEGLFRFLAVVQSDLDISQLITIRLFIRTDLVAGAKENIEQQIENRELRLAWDTQSILNFVLARIAALAWFRNSFVDAVNEIDSRMTDLVQGMVNEEDCGKILSAIFPEKVRRHNVLIFTFLTTYFSDGQGEKASYYPRVYDLFLRSIADVGQLEGGRVAQALIAEAHVSACKGYLAQVKDELKYLIGLAPDKEENARHITEILETFNNKPTPFPFEQMLAELVDATKLAEGDLRRALQQMKRIGIFEERPGFSQQWRAGRLFKSSLGMRYNRKRRDLE